MKTKEELNKLNEEELRQVTGGGLYNRDMRVPYNPYPEFEELEKEMQERLNEYNGN